MIRITPAQKTYGLCGLAVLIVVGGFIFYTEPQRAALVNKSEKAALAHVELELAQQSVDNVSEFQSEFQSILDTEASIKKHFFRTGDELLFFQLLEQTASQSGVTLTTQFTPKNDPQALRTIPVNLSVTGATVNLYAFINALEQLPQYLTIEKLTFQAGDETSLTMELTSYWSTHEKDE